MKRSYMYRDFQQDAPPQKKIIVFSFHRREGVWQLGHFYLFSILHTSLSMSMNYICNFKKTGFKGTERFESREVQGL